LKTACPLGVNNEASSQLWRSHITHYLHPTRYIHYVQDNDITWRVNVNGTKQCGLRISQNKDKYIFHLKTTE